MRFIYPLVFGLSVSALQGQEISSPRWSDLFSYNNILQIREDGESLLAASENGIFRYTLSSGEVSKYLSKANGLHNVNITAFDYNPNTKTGLVGYKDGSIDVITEHGVTYVIDIPMNNGYTGSKKINHISISGNLAAVSTDYGISIFKLDRKEFSETAFFPQPVKEAIIKDNKIYLITTAGVLSHNIDSSFAIVSSWETSKAGDFNNIVSDGNLISFSSLDKVYYGDGNSFFEIAQAFSSVRDINISNQQIVVTDSKLKGGNTPSSIYVFSAATGGLIKSKTNYAEELNTGLVKGNHIYAGTFLSGIYNESLQSFKPDGPYANKAYKMSFTGDKILVSSGGVYDFYQQPILSDRLLGFYYFNGTKWVYPSFFIDNYNNAKKVFNVLDVVMNPSNPKEIFFGSFGNWNYRFTDGMYKMEVNSDDIVLKNFYPTFEAGKKITSISGLTYDDKGNLYAVGRYYNIAGAVPPERTEIFFYNRNNDNFSSILSSKSKSAQKPYYKEGFLWIPTPRSNSFLALNTQKSTAINENDIFVLEGTQSGLPNTAETISTAMDKSGDLWIGTSKGLRVLRNASSAISRNPKLESIIIEEKGIGEELFRDAEILQIEADSGNQKWFSTNGGGVFYLNASGEKTIHHFTSKNSPLPNDMVTDIKVDEKTGKVYFATSEGIVVYQGDVQQVSDKFGNVLVYPNPVVSSQYKGNVRIKGLAEKTNIRITDTAGNLIHQGIAKGGYYEWDLNYRGKRVASGIYFVLMTNEDGSDTATAKIAIIN